MKICLTTVVSADHYQYYVPTFCHSIRQAYPEYVIKIFVRGRLENSVRKLIPDGCTTIEDYEPDYPFEVSTTNAMRFLVPRDEFSGYDYTIITDIDFVFFRTDPMLHEWHIENLSEGGYSGSHGPKTKPPRPEGYNWIGPAERIAGGSFMVNNEWFRLAAAERVKYRELLKNGEVGHFREYDEVMLCKILFNSGLKINLTKDFPVALKCIHIGDFKFNDRWQDMNKMKRRLTDRNCVNYCTLYRTEGWKRIMDVLKTEAPGVKELFDRLKVHINDRGFRDI